MPIQRWFTGIAIVALLASTPVFAAEPLGRAFPAIGDYPNARDVRDRLGNYLYVRVDPGTKKPVELIMANFPPAEVNVDLGFSSNKVGCFLSWERLFDLQSEVL
jgi:hypothetical protein